MLSPPARVPGTAVFLTSQTGIVPKALLHNLKHNKVLHERNVLLTVETKGVPFVAAGSRLTIETIGDDFYRATMRYGFMETPDVPLALMRVGRRRPILLRPDGHHLLRQSREHRREPASRHADLARPTVRFHAPQCRTGYGLLPHTDHTVGRTRRAGRDLAGRTHAPGAAKSEAMRGYSCTWPCLQGACSTRSAA